MTGLTSIPASAFQNCSALYNVVVPTSVYIIGANAFANCTGMAYLTFNNNSFLNGSASIDSTAFTSVSGINIDVTFFYATNYDALAPSLKPLANPVSSTRLLNATFNYNSVCFEENTCVLCLKENNTYDFVAVKDLQIGDKVKTYNHGDRSITFIVKGQFINNVNNPNSCMYMHCENPSILVTGGHSILVNNLTKEEYDEQYNNYMFDHKIDDKILHLACLSNKFKPVADKKEYTYYNFSLDGEGNPHIRYGVYVAEDIIVETPSEHFFCSFGKY